jgi:hypothetical protein
MGEFIASNGRGFTNTKVGSMLVKKSNTRSVSPTLIKSLKEPEDKIGEPSPIREF